jgi:CBS domain-containing protein
MARMIREVMTRQVQVLGPSDTLRSAAELMRDLDVGPVPVCNGQRVVGMLTDRDIVVRAVAMGMDPATTRIADVMSPGIEFCFDDEGPDAVLRRMEARQVRRFIVINRARKLVGLVALADLTAESEARLAGALRGLSESAGSQV